MGPDRTETLSTQRGSPRHHEDSRNKILVTLSLLGTSNSTSLSLVGVNNHIVLVKSKLKAVLGDSSLDKVLSMQAQKPEIWIPKTHIKGR